jgi:hypothetical protein
MILNMNAKHITASLAFLFVIAVFGTAMRAIPYLQLPFYYEHVLHAHSHAAFQGWVYTAMMLFLGCFFLTGEQIRAGHYDLQFKATVAVIIGVLITFTLQGYGLYSILFSTLFQLLNYWFFFRFLSDVREQEQTLSLRFVKTGLWLGVFSTLAPVAIGVLVAKGMRQSEAYHSAVNFFLHFQYNGWFQFVALGLFFKWLEKEGVYYHPGKARQFYWLFTLAVVPAFALSLLAMSYSKWAFPPAVLAACLQMAGLWLLFQALKSSFFSWIKAKYWWLSIFLVIAAVSFFVKYGLQFLSVFPALREYAFLSRNIIVAYLHLSLIGVITCFFMAMMWQLEWLKNNASSKMGSTLFLAGFAVTEALLVISGVGLAHFPGLLIVFSGIMALGVLLLLA